MFSRDLPNISTEISLIIFTTLLAISLLLYLRSHLLYKEIREIRRGFNSGAIETSTSEKKLSKLNFANIMNMVRKNLSVFWRIFRSSHFKPVEIMFSFYKHYRSPIINVDWRDFRNNIHNCNVFICEILRISTFQDLNGLPDLFLAGFLEILATGLVKVSRNIQTIYLKLNQSEH